MSVRVNEYALGWLSHFIPLNMITSLFSKKDYKYPDMSRFLHTEKAIVTSVDIVMVIYLIISYHAPYQR